MIVHHIVSNERTLVSKQNAHIHIESKTNVKRRKFK